MEMLKTLVRDKAQAMGQQNSVVHPEQRKEDLSYLKGFTPLICASTAHASNERVFIRLPTSPDTDK